MGFDINSIKKSEISHSLCSGVLGAGVSGGGLGVFGADHPMAGHQVPGQHHDLSTGNKDTLPDRQVDRDGVKGDREQDAAGCREPSCGAEKP